MDNYDIFKTRRARWQKRVITDDRVVYQCSECGNVDDPQEKECSCCRAEMEGKR